MPVTRSNADFNSTIEWTDEINDLPNTSSFVKSMNLFKNAYTDQTAVLFDKNTVNHTLLASVNRNGGKPTTGKDRQVETFSLPLAYFHDMDEITKADFEGKRRAGTADEQDTLANVTMEKLEDQRRKVDETHEYMMLSAIKGVTKTPDGVTLADMFTEFSVAQPTVDFVLGTGTTNVKAKCALVKDTIQKGLKTGGRLSGAIPVLVDRSFFDKLVNHADVKEAYLNSGSNIKYQDLNSTYLTWGITDVFEFHGLRFMVYNHTFTLPDETTEAAIATDSGHCIPTLPGNQSIFRAIYGPSRRLDTTGGAEMFAREYRDPKQYYHEIEVESSCLFHTEKPLALVKVLTSN